jgi:hypothetical protein
MIAGIPLILIGILIFSLSTFQLFLLYPFGYSTGNVEYNRSISINNDADIAIIEGVSHPLFVIVKVSFNMRSNSRIDCLVNLVYQSSDGNIYEPIFTDGKTLDAESDIWKSFSLSTQIGPTAAGRGFDLFLRIDNNGGSSVTLGNVQVSLTFTLFGTVLPGIIVLAGVVLVIIGFIKGRGPSVPKAKPAPGGWEPTLQWGGGAGGQKQPKMAIKSPGAPKTTKKVVRKAAPAGGAQQACKFCGKPVQSSAFFCPHCYGKLR